jgi:hypothetical protein
MTIERAALFAAIGVLLRGLHYWVANMIPSWNSSGVMDQISLIDVAIADPLLWCLYFVTVWRGRPNRVAAILAALLVLAEIGFASYRQWPSFSLLSLDSLTFLIAAVLPVVFWAIYLVTGKRFGLWYLLLYGLLQTVLLAYQIVSSWPQVQQFWREEPWQLLAAPLIWMVYWVTQTLFVRAALRR